MEVVKHVDGFSPSPQQWLSQWHMQMGWEMLQFDRQEEKWVELFFRREQGKAVGHRLHAARHAGLGGD